MPEPFCEPLTVSLSMVETASYESLQIVDREHSQWIISHVLVGEVTTSCRGKSWQAHAGDVMVHPPSFPFSEIAAEPGIHQWCLLNVTLDHHRDLFQRYPIAPVVAIAPSSQFSQHFCALEQVWKGSATPFRELQVPALTLQLCGIVLECWQQAGGIPRPSSLQTPPDRFSGVVQYITEHLDQKLSREGLAELVHLHPSYFDRAFQRIYGVSPMHMVRNLRLRQGLRLLETTDLPLSAIAYACGLGDAGYFSRVFHQRYHQTPGQYRQSIQRAMIDYIPLDVDVHKG
jgi:AraC-like DNA-binding protein